MDPRGRLVDIYSHRCEQFSEKSDLGIPFHAIFQKSCLPSLVSGRSMEAMDKEKGIIAGLVSVSQLAKETSISRALIYRLIHEGKIRAVKLRGSELVRIPRVEVRRWLEESWDPVRGPIRPARRRVS